MTTLTMYGIIENCSVIRNFKINNRKMAKKKKIEAYISEKEIIVDGKKYDLKKVDAHITVHDKKGKCVLNGNGRQYQEWLKEKEPEKRIS